MTAQTKPDSILKRADLLKKVYLRFRLLAHRLNLQEKAPLADNNNIAESRDKEIKTWQEIFF
jgi:hypothetical protein